MIRVNLLPPEARKAAAGPKAAVPWRAVGIGAGSFFALLTVALFAANALNGARLSRLRQGWQELQPRRAGLEQDKLQLQLLQGQAGVFQQAKGQESRWAPRLNLLSDAVVPQVWFTGLRVVPGQPARLEGFSLASGSGESGAAVSKFLQRLKDQPEFGIWFKAVELQSVEHSQIGKQEVVDFSILLTPSG